MPTKNLEKALLKFFNNLLDPHRNANGICIAADVEDDDCFISCRMVDLEPDKGRSLYITCEDQTLAAFIKKFGLSALNDLERIDKEKMLSLYDAGDADYCCMIDGGFKSLAFTKRKDKIYVKDFNTDDAHILSTLLTTPEDFFDYTEYYFRNRKD